MAEGSFGEKLKFVKEYSDEMKQVASDKEAIDEIKSSRVVDGERVENVLEQFETKIFLYEKEEYQHEPSAQRFLLTASETLALNITNPIIERLKKDRRCKAIGLFTDLKAGQFFENKKDSDFKSFLVFRCINNKSSAEKPQIDHLSSSWFNFDQYLEKINKL